MYITLLLLYMCCPSVKCDHLVGHTRGEVSISAYLAACGAVTLGECVVSWSKRAGGGVEGGPPRKKVFTVLPALVRESWDPAGQHHALPTRLAMPGSLLRAGTMNTTPDQQVFASTILDPVDKGSRYYRWWCLDNLLSEPPHSRRYCPHVHQKQGTKLTRYFLCITFTVFTASLYLIYSPRSQFF